MSNWNQFALSAGLILALGVPAAYGAAEATDKTSSAECSKTECDITCVDPHPACSESAKVIEILSIMAKAYTKGDMGTVSKYLSEGCTTFDEGTKKVVSGKEAVLADIQRRYTNPEAPVLKYTIDNPYAQVHGDTAVVTFTAIKEIGGKHPAKLQNHATDIFIKEGNTWKKLHYRGNWKKIS